MSEPLTFTVSNRSPLTAAYLNEVATRTLWYTQWRKDGGGWVGRIDVRAMDEANNDRNFLLGEVVRLHSCTERRLGPVSQLLRGHCAYCHDFFPVLKSGKMRQHKTYLGTEKGHGICPGSGFLRRMGGEEGKRASRHVHPERRLGVSGLDLVPLSLAEARAFTVAHHRHNEPPIGHKFSIGAGQPLSAVVIAGRPVGRKLDDGFTLELLRLTSDGTPNACSRLYAAARRAGAAMGYRRIYTYTLESESGSSLLAAGFVRDVLIVPPVNGWATREGRANSQLRTFDVPKMPDGAKWRWVWPASARAALKGDSE